MLRCAGVRAGKARVLTRDVKNFWSQSKSEPPVDGKFSKDLPTYTKIDAVEFLDGAKVACEKVLKAMYSQKMVHYLTGGKRGKQVAKPEVAREMEIIFTPEVYEKQFVRHVHAIGTGLSRVTLTEFDLSEAHLTGVGYQYGTPGNMKWKGSSAITLRILSNIQSKRPAGSPMKPTTLKERLSEFETLRAGAEEMFEEAEILKEADAIERIRLATEFHTKITIDAVAGKTLNKAVVKRDIKTTLWFESLVPKSGDLDWHIVNLKIDILNQSIK